MPNQSDSTVPGCPLGDEHLHAKGFENSHQIFGGIDFAITTNKQEGFNPKQNPLHMCLLVSRLAQNVVPQRLPFPNPIQLGTTEGEADPISAIPPNCCENGSECVSDSGSNTSKTQHTHLY